MKRQRTVTIAAFLIVLSALLHVEAAAEEGSRSKSFAVGKGGTLEVSVDGGDIRINVWNKNEVFVRAEGIDDERLDRLKMEQRGNTVRVQYRERWGWGSGRLRFEISLPTEFNAELRTAGGDIEIRGDLNGRIRGSTSGGDIVLGNLAAATVELSTSGGDMRAGDIDGDVTLKTSGGDIELGKVGGRAEVHTSGGDINVESVGKSLRASTSGGDISIGDVGGEAKVSTSGGDVRVRRVSGNATMSTSGGDITLLGASGTVSASTAGGNIRLEDISGSISASTAGGDIVAELKPTGKGRSKLSTAGGEVTLYVPENAKATIEATIRLDRRWSWRRDRYEVRSDFKAKSYETDEEEREIRAVYELNGGGEDIRLQTSNSNIIIRKLQK